MIRESFIEKLKEVEKERDKEKEGRVNAEEELKRTKKMLEEVRKKLDDERRGREAADEPEMPEEGRRPDRDNDDDDDNDSPDSSLLSVNELPDDDLAARGDVSVASGDDETVPKRPAVSAGLQPTTARGEDGDVEAATERAFAAAAARDDAAGTPVENKPNNRVNHGYDWGNELRFLVFLDALPRCHSKEDGRRWAEILNRQIPNANYDADTCWTKLNNLKKKPRLMKMTVGNEKAMRKAYAEHGKAAGPEVRKFWSA